MLLGVGVFLAGERYRKRDYIPRFQELRGELVSAEESSPVTYGNGLLCDVDLRNDRGIEARAALKVPTGRNPPYPVIVTLGGLRSGRHAIEYLGDTGEFMVLAVDYPYEGARDGLSPWQFVRRLPAAHRAVLDTTPAVMLAVDYLWTRGDVDRTRVVLAGGSLGALFAPAVAASDDRITALAILFGAGDLAALVDAGLELREPLRRPVAWALSTLVSPLEPLKYIGRVAPRPVFMLNGTGDARMPESCSRLLHEAARDPKTVRWIPVGHVHIRDPAFREDVRSALLDWLDEIGYVSDADARAWSLDGYHR